VQNQAVGNQVGRRVVTGFNAEGKSAVVLDGLPPKAATYNHPGENSGYNAWVVRGVPADLTDESDPMANGYDRLEPPQGGIIARVTTFYPGYKPRMHRTETIDFGVVISGSLKLGLESGSTILGPGDFVVQRATPHSWRVVGGKPCTIAFILINGKSECKR
jgi:quercetin dioxygenase-like cupin family protein